MRHALAVAAVLICAPAFAQPIFSTGTRNPETNSGNESRDTNPAASNPNLPLPGTANPNLRAAPMVPNPAPIPNPSGGAFGPRGGDTAPAGSGATPPGGLTPVAPGPGGSQGSPSQRSPRKEERRESDDGRATRSLLDIRDAVLLAPAGQRETAVETLVKDLKVFRMNGKVVLTGKARSEEDKEEAGRRAVEAAGGRAVLNRITVE